jgi:hypothetical protein
MLKLKNALLCTALVLTAASTGRAQSDPDFEAALRTAPVRSPTQSVTNARSANPTISSPRRSAAPGMLPAEFKGSLAGHSGLTEAKRAADRGLLDPVAWTEHHAGRIPLMPGARALRCKPSELRSIFTFGIEGSSAFRGVLDELAREAVTATPAAQPMRRSGRTTPSPTMQRFMALAGDAEKLPATAAKLREAAAFLRAQGFVPYGLPARVQRWRRKDAQVGRLTFDIELVASPFFAVHHCSGTESSIPSGPIFFVFPEIPAPDWTDSIMTTVVFS